MRSVGLCLVAGVLSLTLLAAAPSAATAQRIRGLPVMTHPVPVMPRATTGATSHFMPRLGVQPSAFVFPSTVYPYSRRTGTFSAVGVTSAFAVPTNTISFRTHAAYNAYLYSGRAVAAFETRYGVNPYALASGLYANPYLYSGAYNNPYLSYYNPYATSYMPYTMYSGGYGGAPYTMSASNYNPYLAYMNAPSQPTATVSSPSVAPLVLNKIVEVGLYDNRFEPKSVTVSAGTTVRWTNYSNQKHSVTSDAGLWDSRGLTPGATTSYTFTQPGKYTYHSSLNADVHGTVIVQ